MLSPDHIAYLGARGIPEETANRLYNADGSDLLIPYNDPEGKPYLNSEGKPFVVTRAFPTQRPKFKAPHSSGSRPYFSPLMPADHLDNHEIPLVFIEGPIKVDAAYSFVPSGFCFVGVTGTWNFLDSRDEDGNWDKENDTRALPELKELHYPGRKCIILYDSDIIYKPSVEQAAERFEQWIRTQGGIPYRCELPNEADGSKNGADDFLVRHGEVALFDLLEKECEHSGWPLPASLLTLEGEPKKSYTPRQTRQLIKALADLTDSTVRIHAVNALASKVKMKPSNFAQAVIDQRFGVQRCNPLEPGDEPNIPAASWLWDGVIKRGATNMIVASPKVGKSALMVQMIAAIHHKRGQCLGMPVTSEGVPVIAVGVDQPLGDWKHYFNVCGLDKTGSAVPAPLVSLATEERPMFLDDSGMEKIQELCQQHAGALIIIDSYFKATSPLGIDENTSMAAMPLMELQARLAHLPERPTIVVIHHANKSGAGNASSASRGHSSLSGVPSNNILMRWLNPAQDTAEQKDRRVVIDTEGRSKSHRLIVEMTDNGWVVQEQDEEELSEQRRESAEAKLLPHHRKAWEYIRKRWYESNQTAQVTASELRGLSGFDYDQKCRDCMKALEKLGLIVKDGSCATSTGKGRQFLYIPTEGAPEVLHERDKKKTTFLPFSPVSCDDDPARAHENTKEKEKKGSFPNAHVNERWNPTRWQPVERFSNDSWLNGWVVIDESNPDAISISGKGGQSDTVPSYLLRPCPSTKSAFNPLDF